MKFEIDSRIVGIVKTLQDNGYESYIVGGAVRDLLLGFVPKDFDLSTAATPEQICKCFGRRQAMIIGKRFKLVHYRLGREIVEISTFRKTPDTGAQTKKAGHETPENMIFNDNFFGTAVEDAFRRDFTVNALFYDPVKEEIIDHTGMGLKDIEAKTVRAIGDPALRFEEDPVRMLRALKLVGQFDFELERNTENALFRSLDFFPHVSVSRLTLELEKVFESAYGDKFIEAFHDYGLLGYFLPYIEERYLTKEMQAGIALLYQRNVRVAAGKYRNSVSLAMASLLYPLVKHQVDSGMRSHPATADIVGHAFKPQCMIKRLLYSAERIIRLEFDIEKNRRIPENEKGLKHAVELNLLLKNLNC